MDLGIRVCFLLSAGIGSLSSVAPHSLGKLSSRLPRLLALEETG